MIAAICKEIALRKKEMSSKIIQTIYFGGGTPSVCNTDEINMILECIYNNFKVSEIAEITLEANPDDLSETKIKELASTKINRLSIGVQSFFQEDLELMNRAHNAGEALKCLEIAKQYFSNLSIDLIYGIPGMDNQRWIKNLEIALKLKLPHISSYALTVEENTALKSLIEKGKIDSVSDVTSQEQYQILTKTLEKEGYVNYEFSNFGKQGFFSKNNTAYWQGKEYLGVGPSAHSFNGKQRSWNIKNNILYLKSIADLKLPVQRETLSLTDCYNEYVMVGLRTIWGISLSRIKKDYGIKYLNYLEKESQLYIKKGLLNLTENHLHLTKKGKFLGDGISSNLFFLN